MTSAPLTVRFWPHVDMSGGQNACWEWQGHRHKVGHGQVRGNNDKAEYTHRVAWELSYGPIPEGKVVRHTCDNPPCCNPLHLVLGTQKENIYDAIQRKRMVLGGRRFLTDEQIDEIRELYEAGARQTDLGRLYGGVYNIWPIVHGRTKKRGIWKPAYVTEKSLLTIHKNVIKNRAGLWEWKEPQ